MLSRRPAWRGARKPVQTVMKAETCVCWVRRKEMMAGEGV